jgi:hypothetical protein
MQLSKQNLSGALPGGRPNPAARPRRAKSAPKLVRPIPWVSRLSLPLSPDLKAKLGTLSKLNGMAEDEVASAILGKIESAQPIFPNSFLHPKPPGPAPASPAAAAAAGNQETGFGPPTCRQIRRVLKVRTSRKLLRRLDDFSQRSGLSPVKIALLILEESSHVGPVVETLADLRFRRELDQEAGVASRLAAAPGKTEPAAAPAAASTN